MRQPSHLSIVYVVFDDGLSQDFPLGDSLEVFIRRENAERFIEKMCDDDPEVAAKLKIEERELEAGGRTRRRSRQGAPLWAPLVPSMC